MTKGATAAGKRQVPLKSVARLWSTPRASANENRQTRPTPSQVAGKHGMNLATEVSLWATPISSNHRDGRVSAATLAKNARPLQEQVESCWTDLSHQAQAIPHGETSSPRPRGSRPQLGAWFAEWLMGMPPGWTELTGSGPSGMRRYRCALRRRLLGLLGEQD